MKRTIRNPLALFGLLSALAMVCTTSAQAPKPDNADPFAQPAQKPDAPNSDLFTRRHSAPTADPFARQPATQPAAEPSAFGDSPFVRRSAAQPAQADTPTFDPSAPQPAPHSPPAALTQSRVATPLIVGRYQLVSHEGQLILFDTATGECYRRSRHVWESFSPPVDPNTPTPAPHL